MVTRLDGVSFVEGRHAYDHDGITQEARKAGTHGTNRSQRCRPSGYQDYIRYAKKNILYISIPKTDTEEGAGTKFRKSDWYSVWQGHRTFDLFAERNEKIHGSQRRLVSNIYSMSSLKELETSVDKALKTLLAQLAKMRGEPVDMGLWAQLFAFGTFLGYE
jgi:hypothetical protein